MTEKSDMAGTYTSVKKEATGEYSEKKSVFIANIAPVHSRDEALSFISSVKKRYTDARHNVFAYITKSDNSSGYSDDGEPSGTAGVPVLDVLRKKELTDVAVVVTRYFGGILLGTGGLVRAYTEATLSALENSGLAVFREFSRYSVKCDYSDYGKICFELDKCERKMISSDFAENVTLVFSILKEQAQAFSDKIKESTGGRILPEFILDEYIDM